MLTSGRIVGTAVLLAAALASSAQTAQRTVTFTFAPPHGATFLEITRIEKEAQAQPGQPPQRQIIEQRGRYLIERAGRGYLVSVTPMRPKDLVLSEEAEQLVPDLLSRMKLQYELDSSGRLLRVLGVESGLRLLTDALGKDLTQLLAGAQGSKSLNEVATHIWNDRGLLGLFAGQTVLVGEERSVTGPVPLPTGGSVMGNVGILVQGPIARGAITCHSIKFRMRSDDDAIGVAATKFMNDLFAGLLRILHADEATRAMVPKFRYASPSLSVDIERLVDARTGLPHGETTKSVLEATLTMEGMDAPVPFRVTETHTSRFEYP